MNDNQTRLDAADIVFLERELRHVDPTNFMTLFAGLLGRRYIPLIEGIDPLANEYAYKMCTIVGDAKIGAPGANDATVVSVQYQEFVSSIRQIPVTMKWSIRQLKQSAKYAGGKLQDDTIRAGMSAVARRRDNMLAFGQGGANIGGLLNNSAIAFTNPSTKSGTGAGTAWIRNGVPVNPDEILADISKMVSETRAALRQAAAMPGGDDVPAFDRFVLLLDTANFSYISQTPRSTTSDKTILQWALQQNPWLESIEEWWQCDAAGPSASHLAVLYPRNVMAVGAVIPDEWSQEGWQYVGHDIVVPAGGSCGGTVIKYPVACRYMSGH